MTSFPTDLTDQEQQAASRRLAAMADQFTSDGDIRSPEWRTAFLATWRHPYVPSYYPSLNEPAVLCLGEKRAAWLEAVYSDQTLITKVAPIQLSRELRPATGWMFTSSSTLPSLMLKMLETLEVYDGCRVLEIGTGTGYNAALLSQRLGSEHVTSVDIDPELIDLAAERLAANGHTPTLVTGDGEEGYPRRAPYDRIIATCGVSRIPAAWLRQAAPGAIILTDLHGPIGGTLVRLTVDAENTATGRFLPYWAGFMNMRHTIEPQDAHNTWYVDDPVTSSTDIDPMIMQHERTFTFAAQWQLPDVQWGLATLTEGEWRTVRLSAADGSWAEVDIEPTHGAHRVRQDGPRRLWDTIETVHQFWHDNGKPGYDRYGLTATPTRQHIWLDEPNSPHRWTLS